MPLRACWMAALAASACWTGAHCGGPGGPVSNAEPTGNGPFPRTATDSFGDELTLARAPAAIASQALTTDEFLLAVVPPERVAAVSVFGGDARYSFVGQQVRAMDVAVASDHETIIRLRPDLMLASHSARADYVELVRQAGIGTFRMRTVHKDFEGIAANLTTTGYLTGEDAAAQAVVQGLRERIEAAGGVRPAGEAPGVLAYSGFAHTFGRGSLFDRIVEIAGGTNVAAENGVGEYGSISSEQIASWNPDWIVIGAAAGSEEDVRKRLLGDPGVAVTTAARKDQFVIVETKVMLSMSHHAVNLLEALAGALAPESR